MLQKNFSVLCFFSWFSYFSLRFWFFLFYRFHDKSGSRSSIFLRDFSNTRLIHLCFSYKTIFHIFVETGCKTIFLCLNCIFFFFHPCVKPFIGLSKIKCSFFYTFKKVFFHHYLLVRQYCATSMGRMSTIVKPFNGFIKIKIDGGRIRIWIVSVSYTHLRA